MKVEYRIKPVTRYVVTRYEHLDGVPDEPGKSSVTQIGGEYASSDVAYDIGYAVCKQEHEKLGWPVGDERIQYPRALEAGAAFGE